jgi:hypothetical protein
MQIENKYGNYTIVGIDHFAGSWEYVHDKLLDELHNTDFIVNEGTGMKSKFCVKLLDLIYGGKTPMQVQDSFFQKVKKKVYYVDVVSKNSLGDYYLMAEVFGPGTLSLTFITLSALSVISPLYGIFFSPLMLYYVTMYKPRLKRALHSLSVDYRDLIAAAKTILLAKNNLESIGFKPNITMFYGGAHEGGMMEYLSDIELMKKQLKIYRKHSFVRLFDPGEVTEIDENMNKKVSRMDLSQIYTL